MYYTKSFSDGADRGNDTAHNVLRDITLLTMLQGAGDIGKSIFNNNSPNDEKPNSSNSDYIFTCVFFFLICCGCVWLFDILRSFFTTGAMLVALVSIIVSMGYAQVVYDWKAHRVAAVVLLAVASAVFCVVRYLGGVESIVHTFLYFSDSLSAWCVEALTHSYVMIPDFLLMVGGAWAFGLYKWMKRIRAKKKERGKAELTMKGN